jgi:hypothetical protein
MTLWRTAASVAVLMLFTGCTDTGDAGNDPGPEVTQSESEPPVEPTDPETAQPTKQKPSIDIASAPIGGNVQINGQQQCAEVNWLGVSPIPDGTLVKVGAPHLEPGGIFELYQPACPGDQRSCSDVQWQTDGFKPCYVGVRQLTPGEEPAQLILAVSATCATEADCTSLVGDTPGSQIAFTPEVPGG